MANETVKTYQNGSIQAQVTLDRAAQAYRVDLSRIGAQVHESRHFSEPVDAVIYARDLVEASK